MPWWSPDRDRAVGAGPASAECSRRQKQSSPLLRSRLNSTGIARGIAPRWTFVNAVFFLFPSPPTEPPTKARALCVGVGDGDGEGEGEGEAPTAAKAPGAAVLRAAEAFKALIRRSGHAARSVPAASAPPKGDASADRAKAGEGRAEAKGGRGSKAGGGKATKGGPRSRHWESGGGGEGVDSHHISYIYIYIYI